MPRSRDQGSGARRPFCSPWGIRYGIGGAPCDLASRRARTAQTRGPSPAAPAPSLGVGFAQTSPPAASATLRAAAPIWVTLPPIAALRSSPVAPLCLRDPLAGLASPFLERGGLRPSRSVGSISRSSN